MFLVGSAAAAQLPAAAAGPPLSRTYTSCLSAVLPHSRSRLGEKKGRNYDRVERTVGAFQRALTLPSSVSFEEATAWFKDGVLIIKMPKTEASKPHRLQIE